MFEVILHKQAQKTYSRLDDKTARRLNKAIEELKVSPFSGRDIRKLGESLKEGMA